MLGVQEKGLIIQEKMLGVQEAGLKLQERGLEIAQMAAEAAWFTAEATAGLAVVTLIIGIAQCVLIAIGLRLMQKSNLTREKQIDAQVEADRLRHEEAMAAADRRHREAMAAGDQRHEEAMTALKVLIRRTAPSEPDEGE